MSSLLLLAPCAHAGHYVTTYAGGTSTSTDPPVGPPQPDGPSANGFPWGGGDGMVYGPSMTNTASCGGPPITATLTWTHDGPENDQNDPAPTAELIQESCDTHWQSDQTAAVAGYSVSGTFGNPLWSGAAPTPRGFSGDESAAKYSVLGGKTISLSEPITCSVTGSGAPPSSSIFSAVASVGYGAVAVSPLTIGVVGATSDGKSGWDVLVGQQVAPFLAGIPASCTISNYQWAVTGTTMQSWTVNSGPPHTSEVDGPGPLNIASPAWYWNDPKQVSETITCTATITPPVGQGNPFPLTLSQTVGVYLPTWSAEGLGGQMTVDVHEPSSNGTDLWLHASPAPGSGQPGGMTWQATLAPPQNAPVTFNKGNIYLVQTITPNYGYINTSNQQYESDVQGQLGLDSQWPYLGGWAIYEDDPYQPYYVDDCPGIDLTTLQAIYGAEMSSFEDYIMYQPPNSPGYYVPLGHFNWNINGTVTIPATNNWANYKNPAGIIQPSGSSAPFIPSNSYPSWTQNSGNGTGFKPF